MNTRERGRGKAVPLDAVPSAAVGGKAVKEVEEEQEEGQRKEQKECETECMYRAGAAG